MIPDDPIHARLFGYLLDALGARACTIELSRDRRALFDVRNVCGCYSTVYTWATEGLYAARVACEVHRDIEAEGHCTTDQFFRSDWARMPEVMAIRLADFIVP